MNETGLLLSEARGADGRTRRRADSIDVLPDVDGRASIVAARLRMSKLTTAEEGGTDARFLEIGPLFRLNDGNLARRFCFPRQIEAQAAVLAQELLVVEGGRAIRWSALLLARPRDPLAAPFCEGQLASTRVGCDRSARERTLRNYEMTLRILAQRQTTCAKPPLVVKRLDVFLQAMRASLAISRQPPS